MLYNSLIRINIENKVYNFKYKIKNIKLIALNKKVNLTLKFVISFKATQISVAFTNLIGVCIIIYVFISVNIVKVW